MIAVVITTYNHARYLEESIQSCLRQSTPVQEIIVVDDGSSDDPASIVARYSRVRLIRQENRGLAGARNTGLAAARSDFITFLDADDRLLPNAMAAGVQALQSDDAAALVYGAYRFIDVEGRAISGDVHVPLSNNAYLQFLRTGNFIGMHATVVYRRASLLAIGGFDETMRSCEDYEVFMRMAKVNRFSSHNELVAEYRIHGENMSSNRPMMLAAALSAMDKQLGHQGTDEERLAAHEGRTFWRRFYAGELARDAYRNLPARPLTAIRMLVHAISMAPVTVTKSIASRAVRRLVKVLPSSLGRMATQNLWAPKVGEMRFGDFARTTPVSSAFGFDRGTPIDRYYIESFLSQNAGDIQGRVLEIADNSYTRRFGAEKVTKSDILDVDPSNPQTTIIGDLSSQGSIPSEAFDCIILTQTLQFIFDTQTAVAVLADALKPGGVLLLTVPGITPNHRGQREKSWYWSFTEIALRRLLSKSFDVRYVSTQIYGNVFSAVSFLHGLAQEELPVAKLDVRDEAFPVIVAARVVKEL